MLNRGQTPFFLLALCFSFAAQSRVLDFHSDIRVATSGELTVTERITLEVDDKYPHSVLIRELSARSRVIEVIRNGHPEPHTLDGNRLRIGRAPLARGRHLYEIAYRSSRQIRFQGGLDELRWPVNENSFVERVTAEVSLPAPVPARDIRVEASGRDYESFVRDGRAAFRSKGEMTIVVRFPKGVVDEPGMAQRVRWYFDDYKGLLVVLVGLLVVASILARLKKLRTAG
jgi:hypothetical protein